MSVTLPSNTSPLTLDDIRMFLRDAPNYNILLEDVEFSNDDITRAMNFAVDRYNSFAPVTTNASMTTINRWLLLAGTVCILLRSEAARQLRTQVTAQDGNISPVGIDEKQALYTNMAEWYCTEFERLGTQAKVQSNLNAAWGGLGSEYRYTDTIRFRGRR